MACDLLCPSCMFRCFATSSAHVTVQETVTEGPGLPFVGVRLPASLVGGTILEVGIVGYSTWTAFGPGGTWTP